ncbi:MAG: RHS repeat-associated core domain-containing protein [Terriglobia bacterium]
MTDITSTPIPGSGHDYIKMFSETVNPANGSLSVRIQVPIPKGRGLTLPFSFAYDSNGALGSVYSITGQGTFLNYPSFLSQGGWSYSVPLMSANYLDPTYNGTSCPRLIDYVFEDPLGTRHALDLASLYYMTNGKCPAGSKATGGDGIVQASLVNCGVNGLCQNVSVADADGTVYEYTSPDNHGTIGSMGASLPYQVEDRNGNQVTFTDNNNGAFTVADTLGRTVLSSSGFGASGNTLSVSGLPSPSYTVYWTALNYGFAINPQWALGAPSSECRGMNAPGGSMSAISQITLPNGQSYNFYYDPTYGLLKEIDYPSGAKVVYTWTLNLNQNSEFASFPDEVGNNGGCGYTYSWPAVLYRDVYLSQSAPTPSLHQQFTYAPTNWNSPPTSWQSKSTTVQTTDNERGGSSFTTTYSYKPLPAPTQLYEGNVYANQIPVESSVAYTDWGGSSPIRTINKTWANYFEMQGQQVVDNGTVTSDQFFLFGSGAQITGKYECGSGQTCYNATQVSPPTAYARLTAIQYQSFAATPIYTAGPSIFDRPASVVINGSGGRAAETDYTYDGSSVTGTSAVKNHDYSNYSSSFNNRGNATSMSKWVNTSGSSLTWNYTYDDTGQVLSMKDPKTNSTTYSYTDSFAGCGSASGSTNAYLTTITDAKGFTQSFTYRYCDGQLNSATDRNSKTTSYSYESLLNRLGSITYPDTGSTTYGYASSGPCAQPSSTTILVSGTSSYIETAAMDGLCQVTQTAHSDPAGSNCTTLISGGADCTNATYDGEGKVWTVSNPYRSTGESTYGLTTYTYDALGRTTSVAYPDGNSATTSYSGLSSTVTDPAGIWRTLTNDNLGRLASVNEAGAYTTSYTYYATNDLNTVTQGSSQTRTFVYDSVSRLTSATNPESGLTSYTYPTSSGSGICSGDPSSPCSRTDARNITTTYAYVDPLNRLTGKTYSDSTPPVTLSYDQTSVTIGSWSSGTLMNPNGRLTEAITTSSGSVQTGVFYSYDPMGRPKTYWQCAPSTCVNPNFPKLVYNYDLAGDIASWVHPAGFTITNTLSAARQITEIWSSLNSSTQPPVLAQNITYTPWGALTSRTNGCVGTGCTNALETYDYNNRMQPVRLQLGVSGNTDQDYCLVYNYYTSIAQLPSNCAKPTQGTGNNGNVTGMYDLDGPNNTLMTHTEAYTYDNVNRLYTAISQSGTGNATYNLTFSYTQDGSSGNYGNMTCVVNGSTNGLCPQYTFSATTNRSTTAGFAYDAAGDLTSDGTHSHTWDAEGRLLTMDGGTTANITYNALGQMVTNLGSNTTYNAAGERISGSGYSIVPWGNVALVKYGTATLFVHGNVLQSSTDVTDQTGTEKQDQIFYPWGQSWILHQLPDDGTYATMEPLTTTTGEETSITLNRDYSKSYGRWLSPDPLGQDAVDPSNPQTWNMYAYVRNNPTSLIDPSGAMYCAPNSAVVDKNGNTVGYSDCVSEETGASDQYSQHFAPQQENVNAQQGSWLDYILAIPPTYVPNDVPLSPAGQKFAQDLSKIIDTYPTVCGGGGFFYTGRERSVGPGHMFVGAITEIDSRAGTSTGGLFEIGGGEGTVAGGGYIATTNSQGVPSGSGLAYGGVGASSGVASASGGVVGFASGSKISGVGIYGEGSFLGRVLGGGGYLNITNVGSCHQ